MPDAAEVYFIAAMMMLILVISFVAVYFFVRQYRKEMKEKAERIKQTAEKEAPGSAVEQAANK